MKPGMLWANLRFENVERPWLWAALIAVGLTILWVGYRGIFQRSERQLSWVLMGLRAAGLLALVLALARPIWTQENDVVEGGRVAIILDNSVSMSLPATGGQSRYAAARESMEKLQQTLESTQPGARFQIDWFDINGEPLKEIPGQPLVERTDLVRAVTATAGSLRSRPVAALVLVSDGMDNTGQQDFRDLGDLSVPLFAVGFAPGADTGGFDLALRGVRAPDRAMVHNDIKVDVQVSKTGNPAVHAEVVLRKGRDVYARKKVVFGPGSEQQTVALNLKPTAPGTFVYTASVEADAGERLLTNNSRSFPLRVDKDPIRVLYLEGFLRYEYKFLKNRLEEDPDISLVSIVRRANPEQGGDAGGKDLLTPEHLKNFDVLILGDMEASYLGVPEYQSVVRWLDEKGHGLLVLGGYRSFGSDGLRSTPLAEALPILFGEKPPFQEETPFVLQLTEEGKRHPVFEASGDRVKDAAAWSETPPLLGLSVVRGAKPGAEVLAVDPGLTVEGKPAVVLAAQRYGAGLSMALTADSTWRWSRLPRVFGRSDNLYARFWSQAMRWLAARGRDDQRPLLAISTDHPDYDVGKPVSIRAVRQPRADLPLNAAEATVEIRDPAGKSIPVKMESRSAQPDLFSGTFYPSSGGRYEMAASLMAEGKAIANETAEFLVHGSDLELADRGTNRATLQSMANATGGIYLDVDDAALLADKVPRKERRTLRVERTEYWNSPGLFFCFLGAVTVEWFLRRRNHLV